MDIDLKVSPFENKEKSYRELIPQIEAYLSGEDDLIANLANLAAILNEAFNFLWCGFYLSNGEELILGPFQGPIACTRIQFGKGVCGSAFSEKKIIVVPNVDEFPGHIACSSLSRSEIVVPIVKDGKVIGVLDVDSAALNDFDELDEQYLQKIVQLLVSYSKI